MSRKLFVLATVFACATPSRGALAAQTGVEVRWPLVDFLIRGDSTGAVQLLASPNTMSAQGREQTYNIGWLSPDPIEMLQWAIAVRREVDSLSHAQSARARLVGVLYSDHAFLGIALDSTGKPATHFRALFADSLIGTSWQAPASAAQIDTLLNSMAQVASWVLHPGSPPPVLTGSQRHPCPLNADVKRDTLIKSPRLLKWSSIRNPHSRLPVARGGRVWMQIKVDALGNVDSIASCVLLTDEGVFAAEMLRSLPALRYSPASRDGHSVPSAFYQQFRFPY